MLLTVYHLIQFLLILPGNLDYARLDGRLDAKAGRGGVHPKRLQPAVHLFAGQIARRFSLATGCTSGLIAFLAGLHTRRVISTSKCNVVNERGLTIKVTFQVKLEVTNKEKFEGITS